MKQLFGIFGCLLFTFNNLLQAQCSSVSVEWYQVSIGNVKVRATLAYSYSQPVYVTGQITPEEGGVTDIFDITIPAGSLTGETSQTWHLYDPNGTPVISYDASPCPSSPIQGLVNSSEYTTYIESFVNTHYPNLTLDLNRSTVKTMQNIYSTPIITLPFVNSSGKIVVSVEATKISNPEIQVPNGGQYLIMLRDFSDIDANEGGTVRLYDLSYDDFMFAQATIADTVVTSSTVYDFPPAIANTYQTVISANAAYKTRLNAAQAQCDYNHSGGISYAECWYCFNHACQGSPTCSLLCYFFGDVVGWVYPKSAIPGPQCQWSIGIACIYISIAY
jgi:hypothetical protein